MKIYIKAASGICSILFLQAATLQSTPPIGEVLIRQEVEVGERKVILERVNPPASRAATTSSLSVRVEVVDDPVLEPEPEILLLSCTVHCGEMTEVRWHTALGEFIAWSSINFHLFGPVDHLVHGGRAWSLSYGIGDETEPTPSLLAYRQLMKPDSPASWYHVAQAPAGAKSSDYSGLDALHRYFDGNRIDLMDRHTRLTQENAAAAARRMTNPPVKSNAVIRFWPLKSALHLGVNTEKGGEQ